MPDADDKIYRWHVFKVVEYKISNDHDLALLRIDYPIIDEEWGKGRVKNE